MLKINSGTMNYNSPWSMIRWNHWNAHLPSPSLTVSLTPLSAVPSLALPGVSAFPHWIVSPSPITHHPSGIGDDPEIRWLGDPGPGKDNFPGTGPRRSSELLSGTPRADVMKVCLRVTVKRGNHASIIKTLDPIIEDLLAHKIHGYRLNIK